MTHLGNSVFVFPALFKEQVAVHIRRFQAYGKKMYPTKDGINFPADVLADCFIAPDAPSRIGTFTISMMDIDGYQFSRGNQSITLSCDQWNELQSQQRTVLQKVLCYAFVHRDFRQSFETIAGGPLLDALPESFDVSLGTAHVLDVFKRVLKRIIMEDGQMSEPACMAEELWGNDPKTIYLSILCIEIDYFCNVFYHDVKESERYLSLIPCMYVTKKFFESISWETILNEMFEFLCPPNTFEYYQSVL